MKFSQNNLCDKVISPFTSHFSRKRTAFTLAEVFHPAEQSKKIAFTLAEVLITLGIIGVVAALTMPSLIANHRKHVVETRLQKFYSIMNQAIKLSEVENGSAKYWDTVKIVSVYDDDGSFLYNKATNTMEWYKKYLANYLNVLKVEQSNNYENSITIYFSDGSLAHAAATWAFYPDAKDFVLAEKDGLVDRDRSLSGKKYFTFSISPACNDGLLVPYGLCNFNYDNIIKNNSLLGCRETVSNERALCTLLIARNGWKIPKDYPIKF